MNPRKIFLLASALLLATVALTACALPPEPPGPPPEHEECEAPEGYEPWGSVFELGGVDAETGEPIALFTVTVEEDGSATVFNHGNGSESSVQPDTPFFLSASGPDGTKFFVELYLDCSDTIWAKMEPVQEEG